MAVDSGFDLAFSFTRAEAKGTFVFSPRNCTPSPWESRRQDGGKARAGHVSALIGDEQIENESKAGRHTQTHT